jgi:hypothetical protein
MQAALGLVTGAFATVATMGSVAKWALLAIAGVLVLWALSTSAGGARGNFGYGAAGPSARTIRDLMRSAAQWNSRAVQDSNSLIALMHANYAMAYLNVARAISSDAEIERLTGAQLDEFLNDLQGSQAHAIQRLTMSCPTVVPPGLAAVHTGWLTKPGA